MFNLTINKVLWTGGWDSTFRVADLVINKKRTVQPYYIVGDRNNVQVELQTMEKIKKAINELDPSANHLILDTILIDMKKISMNETILQSYLNLRGATGSLGMQYPVLASYALAESIDDLELCIHKDDIATAFIENDVEYIQSGNDGFYKLQKGKEDTDLRLFYQFRYPVFDLTKLDMERIATEKGFKSIMEMTWFCHFPMRGKPCGVCNPCQMTRDEGLGRRVPDETMLRKLMLIGKKVEGKFKKKVKI